MTLKMMQNCKYCGHPNAIEKGNRCSHCGEKYREKYREVAHAKK